MYGIANIGAFGIEAVRHTIQPSIGISYHPDLSSQGGGAYVPYNDPVTGQPEYYNVFEGELNSGIVTQGKSATMTMGLGNTFEAKVERKVNKDSTTVDHVSLLQLNLSSGYDIINRRLSQLTLSTSSSIGTFLSMGGNATYSFYPVNYIGGDSLGRTLISLGQGYIRPVNAGINLNGSFSSPTTTDGNNYDSLRRLFNITSPDDERAFLLGGYYPGAFVDIPFRPTWNVGYGLSYSQSHSLGIFGQDTIQRNFSGNAILSFAITKNWSLSTSAGYDLTSGKIIIPELRVHRDLHCWVMDFSYRPPGSVISGFYLNIHIKASQLQDVKLERTENAAGQF
jgi:hypothetical protein